MEYFTIENHADHTNIHFELENLIRILNIFLILKLFLMLFAISIVQHLNQSPMKGEIPFFLILGIVVSSRVESEHR